MKTSTNDIQDLPLADTILVLSSAERKLLSHYCTRTEKKAETLLFKKGDKSMTLWFIECGEVELSLVGNKWFEVLEILGPNKTVGSLSLLDPSQRVTDAKVIQDSVLWSLDREVFLIFQKENALLAHRLIHEITRQACQSMRRINNKIEIYLREHESQYVSSRDEYGEIAAEEDWGRASISGERRAISRLWRADLD